MTHLNRSRLGLPALVPTSEAPSAPVAKTVNTDSPTVAALPSSIAFRFIKAVAPEGSHRIEVHFSRDNIEGLGFEVTQDAIPGPNGEQVPSDFWQQYGPQKKWVGVHQPSVLIWRIPEGFNEEEISKGLKDLERNASRWSQLPEGASPEFAHIEHREGWKYVLWAHVRKEPHLRQSALGNDGIPVVTHAPEVLAQAPILQALAWQDQWEAQGVAASWLPDGSAVPDGATRDWLAKVAPAPIDFTDDSLPVQPRFLHFWFTHPAFDKSTYTKLRLLDASGDPLQLAAIGTIASRFEEPGGDNGNMGWRTWTLSPGDALAMPESVTVQLAYVLGELEKQKSVRADFTGTMSLEGQSQLNGIGEDLKGHAFLSIAVNMDNMESRQFDVQATTHDGHTYVHDRHARGGTVGAHLGVERFYFKRPLSAIKHFTIGSRPMRYELWHQVPLPASFSEDPKP